MRRPWVTGGRGEGEGRGVATRTRGGSVVSSDTATRGGGDEGSGTQGYPRVGIGTPERRSARRFLLGLDVFERGAGGESERGESGCGGRRRRRSRRRIPGSQSERNLASEKQERKPSKARSRVGLKHAWRPSGKDSAKPTIRLRISRQGGSYWTKKVTVASIT